MKKHTSKAALLIYGSSNTGDRRLPLGRGDEAIYLRLEQLGYRVTHRRGDQAASDDLNDYTLIYVSSLVAHSTGTEEFTSKLQGATSSVVVADEKALTELMMTERNGEFAVYPAARPVSIDIISSGHSLAARMMDDAVVIGPSNGAAAAAAAAGNGGAEKTTRIMWAMPEPSAIKVAALVSHKRDDEEPNAPPDEDRKFVLFAYERGARMRKGAVAPSRRVACFFNDETAAQLTEDGWALFDATISWAVGEELKQFSEVFREEWQEIRERRKRQGIYKTDKPDDGREARGVTAGAARNGDGAANNGNAETNRNGGGRAASASATAGAPQRQPRGPRSWREQCEWYDHPPDNLVGLALSGGGIRSATFCLGLLQGLSRSGMLRLFDYVSTVSGGGYLGGWWSAWLARGGGRTQGQAPYPFFNSTDLKVPDDFIARLLRDDDDLPEPKRLLYNYLRRVFHPDPLKKIYDYNRQGGNLEEIKGFIIDELNILIAHGGRPPAGCACKPGKLQESCPPQCLFDPRTADAEKFALTKAFDPDSDAEASQEMQKVCPRISRETRAFAEQVQGGDFCIKAEAVVQLNRRLLEELLPQELGINLFPGDERIEPVRSTDYFKDRVRRERRQDAAGAASEMQRLIEERKYKEENAETAKELLSSGRDPIHHLRLFSNYLTPRKGFLSADTWRATAAITRNLVMTWFTLIPIIFAAMLAGQLYYTLRPAVLEDRAVPVHPGLQRTERERANRHYLNLSMGLAGDYLVKHRPDSMLGLPPDYEFSGPVAVFAAERDVNDRYKSRGEKVPVFHDFIFPYRELIGGLQRELRDTEASLQSARTITNQLDRQKASDEETRLGVRKEQLASRLGYARALYDEVLSRRLWFALWPLSLLSGWMVMLTCIWMSPSIGGMKKRNIACGAAVIAIGALATGAAFPRLWNWMIDDTGSGGGFRLRHVLWVLTWVVGASAIVLWLRSKWKATAAGAEAAQVDAATSLNWKRSVLGTGVIRAHTLLLAMAFAGAFVLALAGFGHDLIDYIIYSEDGWWTTLGRWAAVLTTGLTVVASIYTAVKGTPKGGGEKSADDKPTSLSRLVFAVTPPAVLLVLTLGISWLAHRLLWAVSAGKGESLGPLTLATLVGVALCLCFSMLESKWRRSAPFKWAWRWVLLAVVVGAAFLYWAIDNTQPVLLGDGQTVNLSYAPEDLSPAADAPESAVNDLANRDIDPVKLHLSDPSPDWNWPKPVVWYAQRYFLLLPMLLALGLLLVRTFAREVSEGKNGRLFSFAPLNSLLSKRKARPYLNRLELFGLGLVVSALVGGVLFAARVGWLSMGNLPDMTAPVVAERMRVTMVAICLSGVVLCWLLSLLELRRGMGNNQRALNVLLGALVALSALLLICFVPRYDDKTYALLGHASLVLLATSLGWVVALGWLADPNLLSMHMFYKSRLVRSYLGASNPQRQLRPCEITETVEGDDVLLSELKNCQRGAPYHLVNTTLNLAAGRDLTTAQRSSAMFVLSKHNCGSSRTGYRSTKNYMGGHLSMGTAVAASGAAASPSMGSRTPPASLAMLMTMLNVRLGFWAPTPNKEHWQQPQPQLWPYYLLREFLSQTNDLSSYSYLTDGGHFDNTGLYSLVERGCRFIVAADCGADPNPCFGDLGEAIRRCRIDFGAEIKLNFDPFVKNDRQKAAAHFIVGTIRYRPDHLLRLGWRAEDAESKELSRGVIIIVKPALVNDEPPDVRQYGIENGQFPQQSTADQWFDEAQFESYRRFGQDCVEKLFARLALTRQKQQGAKADESGAHAECEMPLDARLELEAGAEKESADQRAGDKLRLKAKDRREDDQIDIKQMAKDGSPLTLDDVEEVFSEAYERFRSREMKPRGRGWLRKRLDEKVKEVLDEARGQGMEPTEGFNFYLDRLIDTGVSVLQEIDNPARYINDVEENICNLVAEVIEKAQENKATRLHEHFFFVAKSSRHIFPFAESKENGHN